MRIVQILPNLNSGGVERGTVDFAGELVRQKHHSMVISNGGRLVSQLEKAGSRHIQFAVHKKSLLSLFKVSALRQLLLSLDADIIHVRSRIPAWMTWLALRKIPVSQRPKLVSTFHGLYSISPYSAIMGCGDAVIAISHCVKNYIQDNYPKISQDKISVIHRGVDSAEFNPSKPKNSDWQDAFYQQRPELKNKALILMPARLSRWKGQLEFINLIEDLKQQGLAIHGLIVGEPTPGKEGYLQQLQQQVSSNDLSSDISFLGHRSDMPELYAESALVCNLSTHPEPFGRTVIEALAMNTPVVAYDCGGPAESMAECLPEGLVETNNRQQLAQKAAEFLRHKPQFTLPYSFTLAAQAEATMNVYQQVLASTEN